MPQALSASYMHIVFSTKDRHAAFQNPALRGEPHAYLGGVSKALNCPPLTVGGTADHVHLLGRMARTITQANWVGELKRVSTLWLKKRGPEWASYAWQNGYGCFSVSQSNVPQVIQYISNQEAHHQTMSFQDELRTLLQKHSLEWDERYIWE